MKRHERNRRYRALMQRLNDYGNWWHANRFHVGCNVREPRDENATGIQKRNDVASNPTAWEVENMQFDDKRAMTTETAIRELPHGLRRLIMCQHVHNPEIETDTELSEKTGYERRFIARDINHAYQFLDSHIGALIRLQKSAA